MRLDKDFGYLLYWIEVPEVLKCQSLQYSLESYEDRLYTVLHAYNKNNTNEKEQDRAYNKNNTNEKEQDRAEWGASNKKRGIMYLATMRGWNTPVSHSTSRRSDYV